MANLHFHYGTMGSAKSAQLIISAHNLRTSGVQVEVLKPARDDRFATDRVVSRAGDLSVPATVLPDLQNYAPKNSTEFILIDEIQFFTPADIDALVRIADSTDIIIMCYGLMIDSNENMFPASRRLIEVDAKLHRIETPCQINGCKHLASHHLRFDSTGQVIRDGTQIAVGDSNYKSVCRQHFNLYYRNIPMTTRGSR